MSGVILAISTSPRDLSLKSMPKNVQAAAGTTRVLSYWQELGGLARGVQVINQDSANAATVIINNDRANPINLPASSSVGFSDQWIEQIEVAAGAAGRCDILGEIVPRTELLKRGEKV